MMFPLRILIFLFLASVRCTAAQTTTCQVPDQMKKDQKLPCIRAGSFMVDQPALTVHFKVKYLKPPYPNHNTRYNEVFTEVAASRIMWVLGFPADHVYPLGSAACIGCTSDPFDSNLKDNTASLKDTPNTFTVVSAERETPWERINPEDDETWSWSDAARFYADGEWTHQQRVEYDAYRLALGLFHYHNAIAQQNRLACAQWAPETAGQPRVCQRPMIFVQDLGSTFGKAKGATDLFGTNPRGSFSDWESQTVFTNPQACELRATLDGGRHVLKEAQELVVQRLGRLDPQTVRTIFNVARFQMMDQKQLRRLRDGGSQNPEEAALDRMDECISYADSGDQKRYKLRV